MGYSPDDPRMTVETARVDLQGRGLYDDDFNLWSSMDNKSMMTLWSNKKSKALSKF